MDNNDRSVPILVRSVTHQLYEDKQEVNHITSLEVQTIWLVT